MTFLQGKTALITGVTQGLGKALALEFAQQGVNLILLGRTVKALEALDDELSQYDVQATLVPLDLNALDKILQLGDHLKQRYNHLDIFIANAADLGTLTPLTHQKYPEWQRVFNVNLHANWLLLQTLEPLLASSADPRLFFITTGLITSRLPFWGSYAISKAALEHMALMYAQEKKGLGFKVNCIDPGIMRTQLYEKAMPGKDLSQVPDPLLTAKAIIKACQPSFNKTGLILKTQQLLNDDF